MVQGKESSRIDVLYGSCEYLSHHVECNICCLSRWFRFGLPSVIWSRFRPTNFHLIRIWVASHFLLWSVAVLQNCVGWNIRFMQTISSLWIVFASFGPIRWIERVESGYYTSASRTTSVFSGVKLTFVFDPLDTSGRLFRESTSAPSIWMNYQFDSLTKLDFGDCFVVFHWLLNYVVERHFIVVHCWVNVIDFTTKEDFDKLFLRRSLVWKPKRCGKMSGKKFETNWTRTKTVQVEWFEYTNWEHW